MAVYVPDFSKTPVQIMLGLINNDNTKGYSEADVALRNLTALSADPTGKDTSIEVDLLNAPSEVDGDWVKFYFDRVDLDGLFATVVTANLNNVREVEVITLADGTLDVDLFISEISRKYGVALNKTDFDFELVTANHIRVTAKATNFAYTGVANFTVDARLMTRVDTKTIVGFTAGNVDLDPSDDAA